MIPWSARPTSVCAGIEGVVTDLDDTLTDHGVLGVPALGALHALRAAGIPCVVATGRPSGWGEVVAHVLPVDAVVCENGGTFWLPAPGRVAPVLHHRLDAAGRDEGMRRVRDAVESVCAEFPALRPVPDTTLRATDLALDLCPDGQRVDAELVARARERVHARGLHTVVSSIHFHVSAWAPDKPAGVRAALAALGLDPSRLTSHWLYVGDSPNDEPAFAVFETSIGVANVAACLPRLVHRPRYVTAAAYGAGFAEVAEALCAVRSRVHTHP